MGFVGEQTLSLKHSGGKMHAEHWVRRGTLHFGSVTTVNSRRAPSMIGRRPARKSRARCAGQRAPSLLRGPSVCCRMLSGALASTC